MNVEFEIDTNHLEIPTIWVKFICKKCNNSEWGTVFTYDPETGYYVPRNPRYNLCHNCIQKALNESE